MAKFTAHSIVFEYLDETGTGITPVTVGALTSTGHPLNTETASDDSGGIYDEARSLVSQLPEPTYTTKSIQAIMQLLGLNGQCFSSDGLNPGVRIYGRIIGDCKNNPSATANLRYTIPAGLIVPLSLSVPRTGDATLSFAIHALTDGTNAPFSGDYSSITLPTTPITEKYGIGASKVGAVVWREPSSYTLDFGISIDDKLPGIGSIWADVTGVRKIQPKMTISGQDPTMMDDAAAVPLLGGNALHSNTVFQLKRKLDGGGGFEANSALKHFKWTMNGLSLIDDPFATSNDAVAEITARLESTFDGTNAPVVFSFNQAYSPTP